MMNERIKELARDAGLLVHNPDGVPTKLERFARLIIEECRYVMDCNKGSDQNPAWNQALWETSEKIKQHFETQDKPVLQSGGLHYRHPPASEE
jgi:hypothetical protein